MTQGEELLGGLHFDGTSRDVEIGPTTGIVRYYPVPPEPPASTSWWRYTVVFLLGLVAGTAIGVALCSNFL